MIRKYVVAVALLIGAVSLCASDQQTRDVTTTPVGTASISGVVMTDATPSRPVRRAIVTLGSGGALKVPIVVITDDSGAFAFVDLRPGTYTMVATRAAYVPTAYGLKPGGRGSGVPISLTPGQQLTGVVLKMLHGSVIAGTIHDSTGRPAVGAELIMMSVQTLNGRRKLTPVLQSSNVDSRGEYRVFGLAPGEYLVRAQPSGRNAASELHPTTPAEVEWAKRAAAAAGVATDVPAPPASGRPIAIAPTYFPGTADASSAVLITLGPNEERLGVDFATTTVPVAALSGRVTLPDGQPAKNVQITLQAAQTATTTFIDTLLSLAQFGGGAGGIRVGADGRITGSGITPGHYRLVARGSAAGNDRGAQASGAASMLANMMGGAMGAGPTLWASEDLDIDGRDITGLELRLQPGMTMTGTVVFEGEDTQAPIDASRVQISMNVISREAKSALEMMAGMFQGTFGRATKERTFSVVGLMPDTYRATFLPPGAVSPLIGTTGTGGWVLKSAMLNGKDLADMPIDVRPGEDIAGVVLTFTRTTTQISGVVQDGSGRPVPGFPIVVFPTDRAMWSPGSRRIVSAKPASDGAYKVTGLPAGDYYVCALTELDPNDLYDAAFLDSLVAGAFKITLAEGERKTQDLRLGGGSLQRDVY